VVSPPGTLTANSLEYTGFSRRAEANGAETKRAKIPTLIQNKSTDKSFLGSTEEDMILLDRNIVTSVINFVKFLENKNLNIQTDDVSVKIRVREDVGVLQVTAFRSSEKEKSR